ncbi:MAG: hypothetical protein ABI720_01845 [Actinomycetes bacterium]
MSRTGGTMAWTASLGRLPGIATAKTYQREFHVASDEFESFGVRQRA